MHLTIRERGACAGLLALEQHTPVLKQLRSEAAQVLRACCPVRGALCSWAAARPCVAGLRSADKAAEATQATLQAGRTL